MKYIANHDQSKDALGVWADGHDLIIAKYFFWAADGSPMQTTLEGLLRSLIYSILCYDPFLIQETFPEIWADHSKNSKPGTWTSNDLAEALRKIIEDVAPKKRFCFFVDGLDEHKGQNPDAQTEEEQSRDVAIALHKIASYPNVKICAASRTRLAFERFFGGQVNAQKIIEMQEHTREDIEQYARNLLEEDFLFRQHRDRDSEFDHLAEMLADKAEGKSNKPLDIPCARQCTGQITELW